MENLNTHIPSTTTSNMINMGQPNMAYPQNSQFCYGSWSLSSSTRHHMQASNSDMYSLSLYSPTTYHGTKWRIVLPKVRVSTFLFKFFTQICTQFFPSGSRFSTSNIFRSSLVTCTDSTRFIKEPYNVSAGIFKVSCFQQSSISHASSNYR